jgi:hypothetical protein
VRSSASIPSLLLLCACVKHTWLQVTDTCDQFHALSYDSRRTVKKSKAIPVTDRGGLQDCKMLRIPHCLDNWLTEGGKDASLTCRPPLYSLVTLFLCFWYSFLLGDG